MNGEWYFGRWKTAVHAPSAETTGLEKKCCIVAPPYLVEDIGDVGTLWNATIKPAPDDRFVT